MRNHNQKELENKEIKNNFPISYFPIKIKIEYCKVVKSYQTFWMKRKCSPFFPMKDFLIQYCKMSTPVIKICKIRQSQGAKLQYKRSTWSFWSENRCISQWMFVDCFWCLQTQYRCPIGGTIHKKVPYLPLSLPPSINNFWPLCRCPVNGHSDTNFWQQEPFNKV